MDWEALEFTNEVHVFPLDDTIEHELDGTNCPCGVLVEDGETYIKPLVTHMSLDGRELVYE